ncbi:MAG: hypothetical protein H8E66_27340 [Planctomycetes bacterium]|nr:hypothetical protein [Planctomycetota bacterium]
MENIDDSSLPPITFIPNWSARGGADRCFLIRDLGEHVSAVAAGVVELIVRADLTDSRLGVAAEKENKPESDVTLRIIQALERVHQSKVDVALFRRGDDLFVRISSDGRTWLKYLFHGSSGFLFSLIFVVMTWLYLANTGAFHAILEEAVRQKSDGGGEAAIAVKHRWAVDSNSRDWVRSSPIGFEDVFRENPRLVFFHLITPCMLIGVCSGGVSYVISRSLFDRLCRFVRWPTSKTFDDFVRANESWLYGVVNKLISEQFAVSEADKFAC